jgi:hypothetical protein
MANGDSHPLADSTPPPCGWRPAQYWLNTTKKQSALSLASSGTQTSSPTIATITKRASLSRVGSPKTTVVTTTSAAVAAVLIRPFNQRCSHSQRHQQWHQRKQPYQGPKFPTQRPKWRGLPQVHHMWLQLHLRQQMQQIPPHQKQFLNFETKKQGTVNKCVVSLRNIAFANGFTRKEKTRQPPKPNTRALAVKETA